MVQHAQLQEQNTVTSSQLEGSQSKFLQVETEKIGLQKELHESQVSILTLKEQLNQKNEGTGWTLFRIGRS